MSIVNYISVKGFHPIPGQEMSNCCCSFCTGGPARPDVQHYRLFKESEPANEWQLSIDSTGNQIEIVKLSPGVNDLL